MQRGHSGAPRDHEWPDPAGPHPLRSDRNRRLERPDHALKPTHPPRQPELATIERTARGRPLYSAPQRGRLSVRPAGGTRRTPGRRPWPEPDRVPPRTGGCAHSRSGNTRSPRRLRTRGLATELGHGRRVASWILHYTLKTERAFAKDRVLKYLFIRTRLCSTPRDETLFRTQSDESISYKFEQRSRKIWLTLSKRRGLCRKVPKRPHSGRRFGWGMGNIRRIWTRLMPSRKLFPGALCAMPVSS